METKTAGGKPLRFFVLRKPRARCGALLRFTDEQVVIKYVILNLI